jgi:hypothetical protein
MEITTDEWTGKSLNRQNSRDDSLGQVLFETIVLWVFLVMPLQEVTVPDRAMRWQNEEERSA